MTHMPAEVFRVTPLSYVSLLRVDQWLEDTIVTSATRDSQSQRMNEKYQNQQQTLDGTLQDVQSRQKSRIRENRGPPATILT